MSDRIMTTNERLYVHAASLRYVTKLRHINYDIRRFDNAKATPDHNNTTDDAACTSHLSADDKQSTVSHLNESNDVATPNTIVMRQIGDNSSHIIAEQLETPETALGVPELMSQHEIRAPVKDLKYACEEEIRRIIDGVVNGPLPVNQPKPTSSRKRAHDVCEERTTNFKGELIPIVPSGALIPRILIPTKEAMDASSTTTEEGELTPSTDAPYSPSHSIVPIFPKDEAYSPSQWYEQDDDDYTIVFDSSIQIYTPHKSSNAEKSKRRKQMERRNKKHMQMLKMKMLNYRKRPVTLHAREKKTIAPNYRQFRKHSINFGIEKIGTESNGREIVVLHPDDGDDKFLCVTTKAFKLKRQHGLLDSEKFKVVSSTLTPRFRRDVRQQPEPPARRHHWMRPMTDTSNDWKLKREHYDSQMERFHGKDDTEERSIRHNHIIAFKEQSYLKENNDAELSLLFGIGEDIAEDVKPSFEKLRPNVFAQLVLAGAKAHKRNMKSIRSNSSRGRDCDIRTGRDIVRRQSPSHKRKADVDKVEKIIAAPMSRANNNKTTILNNKLVASSSQQEVTPAPNSPSQFSVPIHTVNVTTEQPVVINVQIERKARQIASVQQERQMVDTTYPQLPNDVRVVLSSPSELPSDPRMRPRVALPPVQQTRTTNMNHTGFFRSPQQNIMHGAAATTIVNATPPVQEMRRQPGKRIGVDEYKQRFGIAQQQPEGSNAFQDRKVPHTQPVETNVFDHQPIASVNGCNWVPQ